MKRTILVALLWLIPISLLLAPLAFADDGGSAAPVMIDAGSPAAGSATTTVTTTTTTATVPSIPDPQAHPLDAATSAWGMIKQYGWLWGSMIVLFGIGTFVIKLNDSSHWLSQDHVLPIAVGVLGMLAAALQAHFAGGSWAGVVATAFAVLTLIIQKPKPGGAPSGVMLAPAPAKA